MSGIITTAIICGTIFGIAFLVFIFNWVTKDGTLDLRRTTKAIAAEKLKAKNKELLSGKYI